MSKKKVLLRGVFINRDTNGEGVLKVGTTLIRVSTVMGILYFVSEGVLEPSMDNEMILTGVGHNKGRRLDRTLGALIKTDFAKKEIISEYMKIIDIIFCKLNIRNCIMHGLGETFDYLNIGIVAIMFQLLWDVAACEIFND